MSIATPLGDDQPDANNATFIPFWMVDEYETWIADLYPLNKRDWHEKIDSYGSGKENGVWPNRRIIAVRRTSGLTILAATVVSTNPVESTVRQAKG